MIRSDSRRISTRLFRLTWTTYAQMLSNSKKELFLLLFTICTVDLNEEVEDDVEVTTVDEHVAKELYRNVKKNMNRNSILHPNLLSFCSHFFLYKVGFK